MGTIVADHALHFHTNLCTEAEIVKLCEDIEMMYGPKMRELSAVEVADIWGVDPDRPMRVWKGETYKSMNNPKNLRVACTVYGVRMVTNEPANTDGIWVEIPGSSQA